MPKPRMPPLCPGRASASPYTRRASIPQVEISSSASPQKELMKETQLKLSCRSRRTYSHKA